MKSSLFVLFLFFLAIKDVFSDEVEVKVGDTATICCQLVGKKDDGSIIYFGNDRLVMMIKEKLMDLDNSKFMAKYPGSSFKIINSTLCLIKPSISLASDKYKFNCVILENGIGKTLATEERILRVYEELKFTETPPTLLNVSIGESKSVNCEATGSPDLQVLWRNQNHGKIVSGKSSALLEVQNVTYEMNEIKYTCEASTSIPKTIPGSIINSSMILNVLFKPDLSIEMSVVHTDIGIKEVVKITVKGNPIPKLDCRLLNINADRITSISKLSPFTYLWKMEIFNVTDRHIGDYSCTATNNQGEITKIVSLNLKPANLQITSSNETEYSDFYLFTWSVNSKAPITTMALTIGIIDPVNGSLVNHVKIAGNDVDKFQKKSANKDNNWKRLFAYPLMNLTSNKSFRLTVRVCNKHDCIESPNAVYFTTQIDDGKNKYDPKSDPQSSNLSGGHDSSPKILLNLPLVVVQSALFCVALMLHHIY